MSDPANGVVGQGGEPVTAAALHAVLLHTFTPDEQQRKVGSCSMGALFF